MCGIGGIKKLGTVPISPAVITSLLVTLEHRGTDATGVALQSVDGEIKFHKVDEPASVYVSQAAYKEFIEANLSEATEHVLLHTRAATTGTPLKAANNHPLVGENVCVVHNGCVSNWKEIIESLGKKPFCETDSSAFVMVLDKEGICDEGVVGISKLCGSAALAAISQKQPGILLLARSSNPIVAGITDDAHLVWASEESCILEALQTWQKQFGLWTQTRKIHISFTHFPQDTAWFFSRAGFVSHREFKLASFSRVSPNEHVFTQYNKKHKTWYEKASEKFLPWLDKTKEPEPQKAHKEDVLVKCDCGVYVVLNEELQKLSRTCVYCTSCGHYLAGGGVNRKWALAHPTKVSADAQIK